MIFQTILRQIQVLLFVFISLAIMSIGLYDSPDFYSFFWGGSLVLYIGCTLSLIQQNMTGECEDSLLKSLFTEKTFYFSVATAITFYFFGGKFFTIFAMFSLGLFYLIKTSDVKGSS